ncbi:hypothetical protein IKE72_02500 [Candidatus Saccharibacteria bacterium]|nr:hypothetical protein [Candidatus Saccharibacteria bacterium]
MQNPLSFNRPGYYDVADVAIDNVGSDGHYWSSSANVGASVFTFNFQATLLYPHHYDRKGAGLSVRCVAV